MAIKILQKAARIVESYDESVISYPEHADMADIYLDMASSYKRLDQNDKAVEFARKAMSHYRLASSSFENFLSYPKNRVIRMQDVAYTKFLLGEKEEAFNMADKMGDYPQCRFCRHKLCYERLLNMGRFYEADHDYVKALEFYQQAEEVGADDSEVRMCIKAMKERVGEQN